MKPRNAPARSVIKTAVADALQRGHYVRVNRGVVLSLIPIALASYIVRTLLLTLLGTRAPRAAAVADASWGWVPLVVLVVVVTVASPVLGLVATVAMVLFLRSSYAIGSPLRRGR